MEVCRVETEKLTVSKKIARMLVEEAEIVVELGSKRRENRLEGKKRIEVKQEDIGKELGIVQDKWRVIFKRTRQVWRFQMLL